jgi:hypothetical protein
MAMTRLTLAMFVAALTAVASSQQLCTSLVGNWVNELGSKMSIESEQEGLLKGLYQTATSSKPPLPPPSVLRGFVTTGTDSAQSALFSFNVNWPDFESMTSWSGQCSLDNDGKEVLTTLWVLTSRQDREHLWAANNVNVDVFRRATQAQAKPNPRANEL